MKEQWQELKETIIELRDNDGTATQQEVCKFLANLMNVLEKQMQEPCEECKYKTFTKLYFHTDPEMVEQESKTGYWIIGKYRDTCSKCRYTYPKKMGLMNYCPACGVKMVEPQESEEISDTNMKMWEELFKASKNQNC